MPSALRYVTNSGHVILYDCNDQRIIDLASWWISASSNAVYARGTISGRNEYLHRLIVGIKAGDPRQVDHINRMTLDNRRCNLRICSRSQNQRNKRSHIGASGFKGVSWHRCSQKWSSKITVNDRSIWLGLHGTAQQAAAAYDTAALHYFGEFACTNASLGLIPNQEAHA